MPYISELLHNQVNDSSDATVGKLKDILIKPKNGKFSPLEFLAIQTPDKQTKFVPYEAVANFTSSRISLKNLFDKISLSNFPEQEYIYLKRDVLDQQIVDMDGTRVVRVNDLRIGSFENKMSVLAIDPSFAGLLRRLGIELGFLGKIFRVRLIDWRQAQLLGKQGALQLNTMAQNLGRLHPADLANIVEDLDVLHGSSLLASLDAEKAAKVLEEVDPDWQNTLIKYLGPEKAKNILAQMSVDELVDLVKSFSSEEGESLLSQMGTGKAEHIKKLISYPDNTAGGLMTLEFITARPQNTVKEVIEEVKRQSPQMRSVGYIYITEENGHFYGVVSLRRLLLASLDEIMKKMVKNLPSSLTLKPTDKMRKIIKLMTKYNLYSAAVVDKNRKLVGMVTVDDVMRQLFPNA